MLSLVVEFSNCNLLEHVSTCLPAIRPVVHGGVELPHTAITLYPNLLQKNAAILAAEIKQETHAAKVLPLPPRSVSSYRPHFCEETSAPIWTYESDASIKSFALAITLSLNLEFIREQQTPQNKLWFVGSPTR